MEIIVLDAGCLKSKKLEKITRKVISEIGNEAKISKEEDIVEILKYGVMRIPSLVVNKKVVLSGRLPSRKEMKEILIANH